MFQAPAHPIYPTSIIRRPTQTLILLGFVIISTILLTIILAWIGKREIKKAYKKLDAMEKLEEKTHTSSSDSDNEGDHLLNFPLDTKKVVYNSSSDNEAYSV